jgi:hypothetical protein
MTTAGVQMEQKQIRTRIAPLAVAAIFIVTVQGALASDECLEKPNAPSPQGSHWYYRTDRMTNRQCWYLGSERGKVSPLARQDTAPARPHSSKMSAPPTQTLVQATAAETAPTEVMAAAAAPVEVAAGQGNRSEANPTTTLSKFGAGIPTPPISSDPGSVSVRDSYAEEQPTTAPQEMGLTGPILSPTERSATVRALASSFSFTQFCAILAIVLGLTAIMGRMIFTLSAGRWPMPNQSQSAQGQRSAASTDEHVLETFAHDDSILATVGYQVDAREADCAPQTVAGAVIAPDTIMRTNTVAAHEAGMPDSADWAPSPLSDILAGIESTLQHDNADWASSPPSDTVAGIESTLQNLLHELEQLRHERACRGFEPTQKTAA